MNEGSVYLNGSLIGSHKNLDTLAKEIREKRRRGELPETLTVRKKEDEVLVNTDTGRALRPLIIIEKGKSKLTEEHKNKIEKEEITFKDLIKDGIVEYLDAEEEEDAYIAMKEEEITKEHTHLEIHPSLAFGTCSSVNPYPEYNMSQRLEMSDSMLKQALGLYATNYNVRMDTESYLMQYPQKPLTRTKYNKILGLDKKPAGQNFTIAVMSYIGYNIDDAIVLNKGSIQRALGRSIYYRGYSSQERRYPAGQKDRFEVPSEKIVGYRGEEAYKNLDENGIIEPETQVDSRDVLISKTSPPRFLEEISELSAIEEKRKENSTTVKANCEGKVDWVLMTEGEDGNKIIKVRTRNTMEPIIGDKFSARHGQKGIVGLIVEEEDMPWTESGVVPDMIFNPHAVPSRMTAGFLLEAIAGKKTSFSGKKTNATAFEGEDRESLKKKLEEYGFKPNGKEVMYDGRTGRRIEAQIFTGIVYYQKLYHLASQKLHARARGPLQILTRQPTEGKSRGGGQKFGSMERDCLIGHGASMLLKERLLKESDETIELICEECGTIAVNNKIRGEMYCEACGSKNIHPVKMSYGFKLLINELKALGIQTELKLEDKM